MSHLVLKSNAVQSGAIPHKLNQLTPARKHLTIAGAMHDLDHLPSTLSDLVVSGSQQFNPELNHLPASLNYLKISGK
jgi:hypothetical protein